MTRIVCLEDDEPFWELMQDALEAALGPTRDTDLVWIQTEHEFRRRIKEFEKAPPQMFILDVMVKWAHPADPMPEAPDDVVREGFYRAGLRCRNELLKQPKTAKVPVVLYSVLEKEDVDVVANGFPENTKHLSKGLTFDPLINEIRAQLKLPPPFSD